MKKVAIENFLRKRIQQEKLVAEEVGQIKIKLKEPNAQKFTEMQQEKLPTHGSSYKYVPIKQEKLTAEEFSRIKKECLEKKRKREEEAKERLRSCVNSTQNGKPRRVKYRIAKTIQELKESNKNYVIKNLMPAPLPYEYFEPDDFAKIEIVPSIKIEKLSPIKFQQSTLLDQQPVRIKVEKPSPIKVQQPTVLEQQPVRIKVEKPSPIKVQQSTVLDQQPVRIKVEKPSPIKLKQPFFEVQQPVQIKVEHEEQEEQKPCDKDGRLKLTQ